MVDKETRRRQLPKFDGRDAGSPRHLGQKSRLNFESCDPAFGIRVIYIKRFLGRNDRRHASHPYFCQLITSKLKDGATALRPGPVADQKIGGTSIPRRKASLFGLFPYDHAQAQKAREIARSNDARWFYFLTHHVNG